MGKISTAYSLGFLALGAGLRGAGEIFARLARILMAKVDISLLYCFHSPQISQYLGAFLGLGA